MANIYRLNTAWREDVDFREMAGENYFCSNCKSPLPGKQFIPAEQHINRNGKDIFFSYESRLLVSAKAKQLLEKHASNGIRFHCLNKDKGVFQVELMESVEFDAIRGEVRFLKPCKLCGYYEEVIGALPAFIKNIDQIAPYGMYFTDLIFASEDYKHPIIILGAKIFKILAENFPEIYEEQAYGPNDIATLPNGETM